MFISVRNKIQKPADQMRGKTLRNNSMPIDRHLAKQLERIFLAAGEAKAKICRLMVLYPALLLCFTGCAVGPDFVRPTPPPVDRYIQDKDPTATISADGQAQHFNIGGTVLDDWWRTFNSETLNGVISEAIKGNPTLKAAQATLRQSQENLRAGYGVFFPQIDVGFNATRQKYSPARIGSTAASSIFNLFTLSATVSYALDVFGGQRRMVEGLRAQVDLQRALVQGTYLTLSGNVVNTVIARAAYLEQIKATEQIIDLQKEQIEIVEAQVRAGTVPYANMLSLQSQLASVEASLAPLKQKFNQSEHLLATLVGRTPAEWAPPPVSLSDLTLPEEIPVTFPSNMVRQRPDILASEAELHSASAEIGVSTAALFPTFTVDGTYGQNSTKTDRLFKSSSNYWSLGAGITAPFFHGGTLWFKRKAAIEGYQQALATYQQNVLSAFTQVADALQALEHDAEGLNAQSKALKTSEEALRLIRINYQAGVVNYLQIVIANAQYHQAQIGYLQAKAQRLQDTVALFVALGGGWGDTYGKKTDTPD
jgi:NodT family efflux transporter outer membrane factor (OMF) lipoprotein